MFVLKKILFLPPKNLQTKIQIKMYAIVEIAGQQFKVEKTAESMFSASRLKKVRKSHLTA